MKAVSGQLIITAEELGSPTGWIITSITYLCIVWTKTCTWVGMNEVLQGVGWLRWVTLKVYIEWTRAVNFQVLESFFSYFYSHLHAC